MIPCPLGPLYYRQDFGSTTPGIEPGWEALVPATRFAEIRPAHHAGFGLWFAESDLQRPRTGPYSSKTLSRNSFRVCSSASVSIFSSCQSGFTGNSSARANSSNCSSGADQVLL